MKHLAVVLGVVIAFPLMATDCPCPLFEGAEISLAMPAAVEPSLSADGYTLYFSSGRSPSQNLDIWVATRTDLDNPRFGSPQLIPEAESGTINTPNIEVGPEISADGKTLYFWRYPQPGKIMKSTRASVDSPFGPATEVEELSLHHWPGGPSVRQDHLEIFFHTYVDNFSTIFSARREEGSPSFGTPQYLEVLDDVQQVHETSPSVSPNGLCLYFSRLPHGGSEYQSWMSCRTDSVADWSSPIRLTQFEEGPSPGAAAFEISTDTTELFFQDVRAEGSGTVDIWVARRALTLEEMLQRLILSVTTLGEDGIINGGQENALTQKLEATVKKLLEQGNLVAACNLINAFINQVEALVSSGELSADEGQALIDAATALMEEIGC